MNDRPEVQEDSARETMPVSPVTQVDSAAKSLPSGTWALPPLLLLAVLTVLFLARELILPVVAALILSLVFLPLVRGMKRILIPAPLGAALVVVSLLTALVAGVYNLAEPASEWLNKTPQSLREIDSKLRSITGSVHTVATATAQVHCSASRSCGVPLLIHRCLYQYRSWLRGDSGDVYARGAQSGALGRDGRHAKLYSVYRRYHQLHGTDDCRFAYFRSVMAVTYGAWRILFIDGE